MLVREIGDSVREQFDDNFRLEGRGNRRWAALRPRTVRERVRQGYGGSHPILQRTGKYRRSFTQRSAAYERVFSSANGWGMEMGSNDSRVDELEGGRPPGSPDMAARPVTNLTRPQETRVGQAIDRVLEQMAAAMNRP